MSKRGQFQAAGCWIAPVTRLAHYIRCQFTCQACGKELLDAEPRMLSLDHLVPRSKGGTNAASNLILVCTPCNAARKNRPWREAYPGGAHARIKRTIRRKLNRKLARAMYEERQHPTVEAVEARDLEDGNAEAEGDPSGRVVVRHPGEHPAVA